MKLPPRSTYHAFTVKANGRANRIISPVKITRAFDPKQEDPALHQQYDTEALWDTGATNSVITQATVQALGLVSVGQGVVNHAGGSGISNKYLINLLLPNGVACIGILVTECPDIVGNCGAIIGMDIIAQGDFSVTNVNGITCMSFRFPSIDTIDYVVDANREKFEGTPRNAPCPCGNTHGDGTPVKFKHCHGKQL